MNIELKYFDITGRGEVLRILLSGCTNVNCTETRISFAEWPTIKPTLPTGAVPILNIDGVIMTQSTSLYRYCAKLVDLYPTSDPFQALIVDETMDILNDIMARSPMQGSATDEEFKNKRYEYRDTIMKQLLSVVESRIVQYGTTTNTVCGIPSVADIFIMTFINSIHSGNFTHIDGSVFEEYPRMKDVAETATKLPIVMTYNASKK